MENSFLSICCENSCLLEEIGGVLFDFYMVFWEMIENMKNTLKFFYTKYKLNCNFMKNNLNLSSQIYICQTQFFGNRFKNVAKHAHFCSFFINHIYGWLIQEFKDHKLSREPFSEHYHLREHGGVFHVMGSLVIPRGNTASQTACWFWCNWVLANQ